MLLGLDSDSEAGAQMMEVLSSELDHRLPHDWPPGPAERRAGADVSSVNTMGSRAILRGILFSM